MEKSIHISHRTLNLSNVSLSIANISSIRMMSFTVETRKDKGGVVVVFQNRGISCLAADRKKRSKLSFWDAMEPGSVDKKATSDGFDMLLYAQQGLNKLISPTQ